MRTWRQCRRAALRLLLLPPLLLALALALHLGLRPPIPEANPVADPAANPVADPAANPVADPAANPAADPANASAVVSSGSWRRYPLPRRLLGEGGRPVQLGVDWLPRRLRAAVAGGWRRHQFNQFASDLVSVRRRLPDYRSRRCRRVDYGDVRLSPASVVVCFHNEAWTTLLRTVHSALSRSPKSLLAELLLVDDASTLEHLGRPLADYMRQASDRVRIVRSQRRLGLIGARLLGANAARSPVLVFLDSHCECTDGWLQPLLAPIAADWRSVVMPTIDSIDDDTFAYKDRAQPELVGGFDWSLQFKWLAAPRRLLAARRRDVDPLPTPTMPGGLFAISRDFFDNLGGYDPEFRVWGAENLELSFKAWMCGGRLLAAPCSRVGHVFRRQFPYSLGNASFFADNSARLADVWMDEYADVYFERNPQARPGNTETRRRLRERLRCRSFAWYVANVYPELPLPPPAAVRGAVRSLDEPGLCLQAELTADGAEAPPLAASCHRFGGNQFWLLSDDGQLGRDEFCFDYVAGEPTAYACELRPAAPRWRLGQSGDTVVHVATGACLGHRGPGPVGLRPCRSDTEWRQRWRWLPPPSARRRKRA